LKSFVDLNFNGIKYYDLNYSGLTSAILPIELYLKVLFNNYSRANGLVFEVTVWEMLGFLALDISFILI